MSYGLAQAMRPPEAIPEDISVNLKRLSQIINDGISKARAFNRDDLVRQGKNFAAEWVNAQRAAFVEDLAAVREKINSLYQQVIPWSISINRLGIGGTREEQRTTAGGSVLNQVLRTFGLKSEDEVYTPSLGGAAAASSWIIPIGAGLLLLLLLRR